MTCLINKGKGRRRTERAYMAESPRKELPLLVSGYVITSVDLAKKVK